MISYAMSHQSRDEHAYRREDWIGSDRVESDRHPERHTPRGKKRPLAIFTGQAPPINTDRGAPSPTQRPKNVQGYPCPSTAAVRHNPESSEVCILCVITFMFIVYTSEKGSEKRLDGGSDFWRGGARRNVGGNNGRRTVSQQRKGRRAASKSVCGSHGRAAACDLTGGNASGDNGDTRAAAVRGQGEGCRCHPLQKKMCLIQYTMLTFEEPWDDLVGEGVRVFDDEGVARRGPRRVQVLARVDHLVRFPEEDRLILHFFPSPGLCPHGVSPFRHPAAAIAVGLFFRLLGV